MIILCPLEFERRALQPLARRLGWDLACTGPVRGCADWIERARLPRGASVVLAGVAAGLVAPAAPGTPWAIGTVVPAESSLAVLRPSWCVPGLPTATLVCVAEPLLTLSSKALHAARTGASLADMESAHFAQAARRAGLRWAIVRGVSDGAHDTLPEQAMHWTDARGRTRLGAVVASVLRKPSLIPELVRLGRSSTRAMRAVAESLEHAHNEGLT
ncbi:MAG: hypothetical protein JNK53_02270 [Phycisphaerae bacterium]|nr:hypothetical protein [Phycisphaerae bacterium]